MYLLHSEISENSVVMIEKKNGTNEPYFVSRKRLGGISGGTMLLGHTLIDLISEPDWFSKGGFENRYYAPSEKHPDGGDVRVLGYRKLTEEEKMEWVQKVEASNLPDLVEIIKSS